MLDGIGFFEGLVVFTLCLFVLGPERLPRVMAQIKSWRQQWADTFSHACSDLERELKTQSLHAHLKQAERSTLDSVPLEVSESLLELQAAAESVRRPYLNSNSSKEISR